MDYSQTQAKMRAMVKLGVPYTQEDIDGALESIKAQSEQIEKSLHNDPQFVENYELEKKVAQEKAEEFVPMSQREITALIAYLQRLGTDIKIKE